jgi:hypothetical protein
VARARLAHHRVGGALPGPLALDLGREVGEREHDRVHRSVERSLAVVEIEEHAHARVEDLFQHVGRLDRLAANAALLGHHEHLERWARGERVQEPGEPGAAGAEDGAADRGVAVDVLRAYRPALALRVGASGLDLPRDRARLVGDVGLVGWFSGIDRGCGHRGFLRWDRCLPRVLRASYEAAALARFVQMREQKIFPR